MIDCLKSAGDRLRKAWSEYLLTCSKVNDCINPDYPRPPEFLVKLHRQLNIEMESILSYETDLTSLKFDISFALNSLDGETGNLKANGSEPHDGAVTRPEFSPLGRFFKSMEQKSHSLLNAPTGLAPINSLPPEILVRIFRTALAQPCNLHLLSPDDKRHYPKYPDYLAQVCSRWRGIAISTCSFWYHIDLSPYELYYDQLASRAERHIDRAGSFPVELHIAENKESRTRSGSDNYHGLFDLVSRISGRVESLKLATLTEDLSDFQHEVFKQLLLAQPSVLTKLTMRCGNSDFDAFIVAESDDSAEVGQEFVLFRLEVSDEELRNGFAPLTTLHLHGIFPYWSSVAYHRLVDLRLMSTNPQTSIKAEEFVAILRSSPGLCILHFGLNILEPVSSNGQIAAVRLSDLQVVKIFPHHPFAGVNPCPSKLLRLLAPGAKPLRLSIEDYYIPNDGLVAEMEKFFARSKVERFYTRVVFPPMALLRRHAAHLELVILDEFESYSQDENSFTQLPAGEPVPFSLNSIHVIRSSLSKSDISLLLEYCPNGTVLYSCDFIRDSKEASDPQNVSELFPSIKVSDYNLYPWGAPTTDWDLLD